MAWPRDARHYDFTPLGPVPSASLNAIQDVLQEICEERAINSVCGVPVVNGSQDPSWKFTNSGDYWECIDATSSLYVLGNGIPEGAILNEVHVKFYLASATGLTLQPFKHYNKTDAAGIAAGDVGLDSPNTPTYGGSPAWDEVSFTGLALTIAEGMSVQLLASDPDAGDCIGGVRFVFYPFTHS